MSWKLPPRRFPHGSYSEIPLDLPPLRTDMPDRYSADAIKGVLDQVAERDEKIAEALLDFHKALSAGLDWMQEQLGSVFIGVTLLNQRGQLTITGTNTNGTFTFPTEEIDTNYSVLTSLVGTAGSPVNNSLIINGMTKATTGVTISLLAAPGGGNTVSFDVVIAREIFR